MSLTDAVLKWTLSSIADECCKKSTSLRNEIALASGWKRQEVPNAGMVDAITTTDVSAEQGKSGQAANLAAMRPVAPETTLLPEATPRDLFSSVDGPRIGYSGLHR